MVNSFIQYPNSSGMPRITRAGVVQLDHPAAPIGPRGGRTFAIRRSESNIGFTDKTQCSSTTILHHSRCAREQADTIAKWINKRWR